MKVTELSQRFGLPIIGAKENQFVLMYKPSIWEHPLTKENALQINMFELPMLNKELRRCFMNDYKGRTWFWHRFFWKLPNCVFNSIEFLAVLCISCVHSPRSAFKIVRTKAQNKIASRKNKLSQVNTTKVGSCFNAAEVKVLAQSMPHYYSSCL